jgi:rSAM/selenodomain-associated transferase 2
VNATPRLSVVVPVLGDTDALARLLAALASQSPVPAEVVVADGAGSGACRALCAGHGARHLAAPPGRGRQLAAGARAATGEVLWFLHADAGVPAGATRAILAAVEAGASGGCFRFGFAGRRSVARSLLAATIDLRARLGVPYGDQGLFATRAAYVAAGGFADEPLFEEVPLVRGLRRHGRFAHLPLTLGVSPRRWERDGWVRRTVENRLLALAYAAGVSPARLARRYRSERTAGTVAGDGTEG